MVNEDNVIEVTNITKTFKVYMDKAHTLKDRAINLKRNNYEKREVLKGISFQVKKGEAVGLVGHNGCGKSTTLKLLTRIMYPDSGTVEIKGRVSSLLELGAGFHPDMSGRENIYINASIFGLTRNEIESKIDEIIEFSELREFIDNPVRTYSSGMYMRLAFSVAISVNAEVLLIDEILGVGDVNFQTKCFNKLMEIKGTGTTIVLVSHSTAQVERICDRSIWIQDGLIQCEGNPIDVHREYLNYMGAQRRKIEIEEDASKADEDTHTEKPADEEAVVKVESAIVVNDKEKQEKIFQIGEQVGLEIVLHARQMIKDYYIEINLVRADGLFCYGCSTAVDGVACEPWTGTKKLNLSFPRMNLLVGKYHFDIHVANADGSTICFGGNVATFEIDSNKPERGSLYLEHTWTKG
jgi:ABC-2 type transport system ATP-binding protein